MIRYLVPLLIAGVFACLLLGWGLAWYFSKDESRPIDPREDPHDPDS